MNCTQCGNPLEEGSKFCTSCGAPVPEPQTAPEKTAPQEEAVQASPEEKAAAEAPAPEPVAEPVAETVPEAPAPQPEQPKEIPAPVATDVPPGEILNRQMGNVPPQQGYVPPQQGYVPPQQGYVPPQQGYVPPQQGYVPPQQGYVPPQQGYVPPQQGYVPPQQGYVPPQQGYVPPQQGYVPPVSPEPKKPKKKSKAKKWILISVCLLLAVAVVLAIFNWKTIDNTFKKMTMSDKDYFAYVNSNITNSLIGSVSSGASLPVDPNNFTINGSLSMKLEESAKQLLKSTLGDEADISWFNELGYTFTGTTDKGKASINAEMKLNGQTILTAILTVNDTKLTVSIPELSESAISFDFGDALADGASMFAMLEEYSALLPSSDVIERMLTKYIDILFKSITDVSKADMSVTAGGVSKDLSVYTAKIDESVVKSALKEMASQLANDEDFKNLVKNICDSELAKQEGVSYAEVWSTIQTALSSAGTAIEMINIPAFEIDYTLYVDGSGNVVGSALDGFGVKLSSIYVENGGKFGHEIVFASETEGGVKLIGEGTVSGGKLNGKYSLKVQMGTTSMSVAVMEIIDWDVNSANEGRYNGKLIFKLDPNIASLINMGGSIPELNPDNDNSWDNDDWDSSWDDEGWDNEYEEDYESSYPSYENSWGTGTVVRPLYSPVAKASSGSTTALQMLSQIALSVEFKSPSTTETTVIYSILLNDNPLVSMTASAKLTNGGTVTLPSNTIDYNDKASMDLLLKDAEKFLATLAGKLETAGVPKEFTELLSNSNFGGNSSTSQQNPTINNPLVGMWMYSDEDYTEIITLESNMTGNVDADGEIMYFTYSFDSDYIHFDFENFGSVSMEYDLDGSDKLYLTNDNNETLIYYAY